MSETILARIQAIRHMSVAELLGEWEREFGQVPRTRNREQLWRRLAWKLQEREHGGLPDEARMKFGQLRQEFCFGDTPKPEWLGDRRKSTESKARPIGAKKPKAVDLPPPGSVITRRYKGQTLVVQVRDNGFLFEERLFRSLSAIATEVTGTRWNGRLFFGLKKR